jgi:hypothetical protein
MQFTFSDIFEEKSLSRSDVTRLFPWLILSLESSKKNLLSVKEFEREVKAVEEETRSAVTKTHCRLRQTDFSHKPKAGISRCLCWFLQEKVQLPVLLTYTFAEYGFSQWLTW